MKCTKRRTNGEECRSQAVVGTDACRKHAGRPFREQQARGAVVTELRQWGLTDELVDSKTAMLRLMSQAYRRALLYSARLEQFVNDAGGDLNAALISDTDMPDGAGGTVKVGEYLVGLQRLEAEERDRAFRFAERAVAAGLDERMVRVAESQAALVVEALKGTLQELQALLTAGAIASVDPSQPEVLRVMSARLRALDGGL